MSDAASRPNLLFVFPDQWRWDWLGCEDSPYGKVPVQTPHIDALAARGVRFTQCRTNSPVCSPARACLAQGLRYERCGVRDNRQLTPTDRDSVFKLLRDRAGYHTTACGKTDLFKPWYEDNPTGFAPIMDDYGFSAGIDHRGKGDAVRRARKGVKEPYGLMLAERGVLQTHLDDHPPAPLERPAYPTPLPEGCHTDDFAGANAIKLIDGAPSDRPWCLWVNFPGPHDPFDPPAKYAAMYDGVDFPEPANPAPADQHPAYRDVKKDRQHYAGSCTNIDDWVGRIVAHVEARGELDHTLIVFSSDHGEMLGDHGRWTKQVPQEGSVHVPLIVAGPGVRQGAVSDALVELIDVSATLLDTAGLATPDDWDARSFGPVLDGSGDDASHRAVQLSSLDPWQSVFDGRFKLVRRRGKADRLFDLQADPEETTNVAADRPEDATRLAACLPPMIPAAAS